MKTLLILGGDTPLPDPVRDVIARGSTSLEWPRDEDRLVMAFMTGA